MVSLIAWTEDNVKVWNIVRVWDGDVSISTWSSKTSARDHFVKMVNGWLTKEEVRDRGYHPFPDSVDNYDDAYTIANSLDGIYAYIEKQRVNGLED